MALKTPEVAPPAPPVHVNATPVIDDAVLLELALYSRYTRGRNVYVKDQVYKFKKTDALQLLSEMDAGRPIWKLHRKPVARKQTATPQVMDATSLSMERTGEPLSGLVPETPTRKRIEVGTDDEIQDILAPLSTPDDVTL